MGAPFPKKGQLSFIMLFPHVSSHRGQCRFSVCPCHKLLHPWGQQQSCREWVAVPGPCPVPSLKDTWKCKIALLRTCRATSLRVEPPSTVVILQNISGLTALHAYEDTTLTPSSSKSLGGLHVGVIASVVYCKYTRYDILPAKMSQLGNPT